MQADDDMFDTVGKGVSKSDQLAMRTPSSLYLSVKRTLLQARQRSRVDETIISTHEKTCACWTSHQRLKALEEGADKKRYIGPVVLRKDGRRFAR